MADMTATYSKGGRLKQKIKLNYKQVHTEDIKIKQHFSFYGRVELVSPDIQCKIYADVCFTVTFSNNMF